MIGSTFPTVVILNLFQDPSRVLAQVGIAALVAATGSKFGASERAAAWMLKQIQHDGIVGGLGA